MGDDRQSTHAGQRVVRVGCSQLGPHPRRYFRRFSALELQQTFFNPPRPATLQRLRDLAQPSFSFVVKAWQLITHEPSSPSYRRLGAHRLDAPAADYGLLRLTTAVQEAVRVTLEGAAAVKADALLFETPPSFTPSAQSRARMTTFFERLERAGRLIVWDPRGLWSRAEAARVCADLQLVLCTDPLQPSAEAPESEEVIYFRVPGLGRRQGVADADLLDLADKAEGASGYCIFDTVEMHRDAERLLSLLSAESEFRLP